MGLPVNCWTNSAVPEGVLKTETHSSVMPSFKEGADSEGNFGRVQSLGKI